MRKSIIISLVLALLLICSVAVTAIDLIPSFFDKITPSPTDELAEINYLIEEDFGREGWYDGTSYDGQQNSFGINIKSAPTSVEYGKAATVWLDVTNLQSSTGEMWVQCSILSVAQNSWLSDVSRRSNIGFKQPSSVYNCKDEDFTVTGKIFLTAYASYSYAFEIPESQAGPGEEAVIYCAAYERCSEPFFNAPVTYLPLDPYSSDQLKRSITIEEEAAEPDTYTCTDPDGASGWDTQRTVVVKKVGTTYDHDKQTDSCPSSTQLKEFYCPSSSSSTISYKYHTCESDEECKYGACVDKTVVATCSDGIKNQGELGIDCGGPCDPCQGDCVPGAACTVEGVAGTKVCDSNAYMVKCQIPTTGSNILITKIEVIDTIETIANIPQHLEPKDIKITVKNFGNVPGTINLEYGIYSKYWLQKHNLMLPDTVGGIDYGRAASLWDWKTPCAKYNNAWCNANSDCEDFVTAGTILELGPGDSVEVPITGIEGLFLHHPRITKDSVFADQSSAVDPLGEYVIFTNLYLECGQEPNNNAGISRQTIMSLTQSNGKTIADADAGFEGTWAFVPIELEDENMAGTKQCTEFSVINSCDDGNTCTYEICKSDGTCERDLEEIRRPNCECGPSDTNYCESDTDADDDNPFTADSCDLVTRCSSHIIVEFGECGPNKFLWDKLFGEECIDKKQSILESELADYNLPLKDMSDNDLKNPDVPICTYNEMCLDGKCIMADKKGTSLESKVWYKFKDELSEISGFASVGESVVSWINADWGIESVGLCIKEEESSITKTFNKLVISIQDMFGIKDYEDAKLLTIGILGLLVFIIVMVLLKQPRRRI